MLQNESGCDSLIILEVELLESPTFLIWETTCDPNEVGIYDEVYAASNGCDSLVRREVRLADPDDCGARADSTIYVPNIFSPNADGANDYFIIYGGVDVFTIRSFQIYNRWGEKVFEGRDVKPNTIDGGWDGTFKGKELNPGVYTDSTGFFELQARNTPATLRFTYLGYEPEKGEFAQDTTLKIFLVPGESLDELTVVSSPLIIDLPVPHLKINATMLQRDDEVIITPVLNRVPGIYIVTKMNQVPWDCQQI